MTAESAPKTRRHGRRCRALGPLAAVILLAGCGSNDTAWSDGPIDIAGPPPESLFGALENPHDHATRGPHGGLIVELGRKHQYHAELVADRESRTIVVHVLDRALQVARARVDSMTLNVTSGDRTTSHRLTQVHGVNHAGACCFRAAGRALFEASAGLTAGKLYATIDGVPYVGRIDDEPARSYLAAAR